MNYFIAYPKEKIPVKFVEELSKHLTIYYPLRRLSFCELNVDQLNIIEKSDYLMFTSNFALKMFIKKYLSTKIFDFNGTYAVLSKKMAESLVSLGITKILISDEKEDKQSLINTIYKRKKSNCSICYLCGNKSDNTLGNNVHNIICYENVWNKSDIDRSKKDLCQYSFDRVLITSPSSFQRYKKIFPKNQLIKQKFYTLGDRTKKVIENEGYCAVGPNSKTNVLKNILSLMLENVQ
ncbi:MAG: uroporphyrinogen-III synthase [Firmicutes bacterium]|uniref:Uroporphyrinogen-III synthase n=1 Tax=Candidatus Gallilactobacillus intestinavium TaxID=2840838 RepID=A0A9D9EB69_9LACO|nr:uroporphyrinogen-III synthase [Candidatus Gallilactobacillus intestinavium]